MPLMVMCCDACTARAPRWSGSAVSTTGAICLAAKATTIASTAEMEPARVVAWRRDAASRASDSCTSCIWHMRIS